MHLLGQKPMTADGVPLPRRAAFEGGNPLPPLVPVLSMAVGSGALA